MVVLYQNCFCNCGDVMSRRSTFEICVLGSCVRCRDATSPQHGLVFHFIHKNVPKTKWPISSNPCESQTKLWHLLKSTMMHNQQISSNGGLCESGRPYLHGKSYFTKISQFVQCYWTWAVLIRRACAKP